MTPKLWSGRLSQITTLVLAQDSWVLMLHPSGRLDAKAIFSSFERLEVRFANNIIEVSFSHPLITVPPY